MRKILRVTKRVLAGTLAAMLLFTSVPTSTYAIEPMDTTEIEQNVGIEELMVNEAVSEYGGGE